MGGLCFPSYSNPAYRTRPMVTINFGTTFTRVFNGTITRRSDNQPDYIYDTTQIADAICIRLTSPVPAERPARAMAYACPVIRTSNPTGFLYLQAKSAVLFANQLVLWPRVEQGLGNLDNLGGSSRRDLCTAVWLLTPYTEGFLEIFTG